MSRKFTNRLLTEIELNKHIRRKCYYNWYLIRQHNRSYIEFKKAICCWYKKKNTIDKKQIKMILS